MFTDIEGSTQLWERHPDSMTAALSRHDSVLEDEVSRFGGKIIAHGGDGIFATFEGGQPLECVLSVQRQFQQEDWGEVEELRIRVGLHFGTTEVRGANHSGPVVNRSARVMASGWGGQVLVTPEVTNIHSLPDGASINDLGTHLLKDLSEPQQIFGLVHPDLRMTEFPPLRTLSSQPNNLPAQTTPFVGRESELAQTSTLLEDPQTRLLTLIGPGGIGKTRLSIQVASENSDQFRDGVWFVPLAPLDSTDLIVSTIAESLRFSFYNPQDLKAQLLNYLKEKQILLVIDNLEHLMTGSDLIAEILQGAPDAKMMVTSRERLNLRGEQIVDVEGLDMPTNGHIEDADSYAAIQLFVQGASRAQPGYALSGEDIQSAGQICRMVGGLPLGIELASAWTRVLTCQEIASEIEQSIDFLGGTLRDLPERQRSLRAVVDYSWEMLTDTEQTAFMSMAVFSGGFTREAAQQVSGASLMALTSLQDKSLLRFNSARRYEFQPVLQQYAEDKFRESQEEFDRVQRAHAEYYSSFLQARSDPILAQEETILGEIGAEIENVRSAWQWAVEHKSFERLAQSVDALFIFYQIRGWYEEGNQVFSGAIEMMRGSVDSDPEQETTSGKFLACQGAFQLRLGVPAKARELLEESRDIFRRNDANNEIGFCLNFLGLTARMQGEFDEAKGFLDTALSVNQETGDRFEEALSLQNLGTVAFSQGDYQEARQLFQSSLESRTQIGERQGIAYSLKNLALVANLLGEYDESDHYFQESYSAFEAIGNRWGMATCLNNRSYGRYLQGDYEEGYQQYEEALTIFKEIGDRWATANCLIGMGDLSIAQEDNQGAADHYTEAISICDDIGAVPLVLYAVVSLANLLAKEGLMESGVELMTLAVEHPSTEQEAKGRGAQILEEFEAQMPAEAFVKAQSSGRAMSLDDAVARILRA